MVDGRRDTPILMYLQRGIDVMDSARPARDARSRSERRGGRRGERRGERCGPPLSIYLTRPRLRS